MKATELFHQSGHRWYALGRDADKPDKVIDTNQYVVCYQDQAIILEELSRTRPLSVVMREKIDGLRAWAKGRTVNAHLE